MGSPRKLPLAIAALTATLIGAADLITSGDKGDLLPLSSYRCMPTITARGGRHLRILLASSQNTIAARRMNRKGNRRKQPTLSVLLRLAEGLQYPLADFMGRVQQRYLLEKTAMNTDASISS